MDKVTILENGKVKVEDRNGGITLFSSVEAYESAQRAKAANMDSFRRSGLGKMHGEYVSSRIERRNEVAGR